MNESQEEPRRTWCKKAWDVLRESLKKSIKCEGKGFVSIVADFLELVLGLAVLSSVVIVTIMLAGDLVSAFRKSEFDMGPLLVLLGSQGSILFSIIAIALTIDVPLRIAGWIDHVELKDITDTLTVAIAAVVFWYMSKWLEWTVLGTHIEPEKYVAIFVSIAILAGFVVLGERIEKSTATRNEGTSSSNS